MPRYIAFQIWHFLLRLEIHLDTKLDEHGKLLYWGIDDDFIVREIWARQLHKISLCMALDRASS